jgi:hypothetical protein
MQTYKELIVTNLYNYSTLLTQGTKYLPINNQWSKAEKQGCQSSWSTRTIVSKTQLMSLTNTMQYYGIITEHINRTYSYADWIFIWSAENHDCLISMIGNVGNVISSPAVTIHNYTSCNWNWPFQVLHLQIQLNYFTTSKMTIRWTWLACTHWYFVELLLPKMSKINRLAAMLLTLL